MYDAKFVAMLEQLDLFSALTREENNIVAFKPLIERKLVPPPIIEIAQAESETISSVNSLSAAPDTEETISPEIAIISSAEETFKKSARGRKSQKEMSLESGRIEVPEDSVLFSKQYYAIGEVATMFSVNTSLLRYWESEFDILKPRKNRKGDRFFRPEDIKNLLLIHHLLRERKYTIEGAKDFLKNGKKANAHFEAIEKLKAVRVFLLELKAGL